MRLDDHQKFLIERFKKEEEICKKEHGSYEESCIASNCFDRKAILRMAEYPEKGMEWKMAILRNQQINIQEELAFLESELLKEKLGKL